jgi:hypothetical protein
MNGREQVFERSPQICKLERILRYFGQGFNQFAVKFFGEHIVEHGLCFRLFIHFSKVFMIKPLNFSIMMPLIEVPDQILKVLFGGFLIFMSKLAMIIGH